MASGGAAIEIHGAKELRRSLRKAGADMKQMREVNKAAGEIVARAARGKAPVSTLNKRTHLRDTIRVFATQTRARIRLGAKPVPYSAPIHWGWPKRSIKANPFVSHAAQETEPAWLRLYEHHVNKILDQIEGTSRH